MKPKSHKEFIQATADRLDKEQDLVEDVVEFLYSSVRKALTETVHPNVHIDNLGTFRIRPKKLKELHHKYEKHLEALQSPETFNQMRIKKETEEKLDRITKVSGIMKEEQDRKNQIKKQRHEFINNQNLEE